MRLLVKICGLMTRADVEAAATAGADALGFVFAESPRRLEPFLAGELARGLPRSMRRVAVFRHPSVEEVLRVLDRFDADVIQAEPAGGLREAIGGRADLWPVLHDGPSLAQAARRAGTARGPVVLEGEGAGGRGVPANRARAADLARAMPVILAGGLSPENVAGAIRRVRPFGVDVATGVESAPGVKDHWRIARFVAEARRAQAALELEEQGEVTR